jgi:diaminohydroxyphosphoribosylaminopyrimidine deaminase / 5-amino-6-(5-phosphoribosylamino)uracil reductase
MPTDDKFFMHEAMLLAEKGRGFVSPNPLVGAVIVKNNKIIGWGYHKKFGDAHAEVNAFKNAKKSVKGAKLYVTLEPCNYWGKKTPPCVPAIIDSGIKEVVIGTLDCNPRVCSKGVADLRKAGIKTKVGVMRKEIEQQNESYFKYSQKNQPFVILKLGLSLDGRIAMSSGESKWITNPQSRKFGQELRKKVDAILVGINTIIKDNPRLSCRIEPRKVLIKVILDPYLLTPPHAKVLKGKCPTLIFANKNSRSVILSRNKNFEIIRVESDQNNFLSWEDILKELAKRKIASVLIEGGAQVASSALQSNVVDKLYLIYAPKILGKGITFSDYLSLDGLKSAIQLKDYKIFNSGKDFILEAYVQRHN